MMAIEKVLARLQPAAIQCACCHNGIATEGWHIDVTGLVFGLCEGCIGSDQVLDRRTSKRARWAIGHPPASRKHG